MDASSPHAQTVHLLQTGVERVGNAWVPSVPYLHSSSTAPNSHVIKHGDIQCALTLYVLRPEIQLRMYSIYVTSRLPRATIDINYSELLAG